MGRIVEKMNNAQNCLYSTKQYELGYKYALEAYMMNPDNPETKYLYAVALYFNDRCEEALRYFYELEKILKYPEAIYIYIAHSLSKTRKNLLLALKYVNKAMKVYHYDNETKMTILMMKAEIQYRMGDINSALNNFLKAYNMGDDDKSLCYIARIYFDENKPMLAMKYLRKVLHFEETDKEELWQNMEKLTFEELQTALTILLNRYELNENKKQINPEIDERIQKKLYP